MIDELLRRYPLISDQVDRAELRVILAEFAQVLDAKIPGDVVEFGCYKGTTSLFLARILQRKKSEKRLFLYDSFAGLPEKSAADFSGVGTEFRARELATTKREISDLFARNFPAEFTRAHVKITKSWFAEIRDEKLPDAIAFAFFDGDFYESIRDSFQKTATKFSAGATIVVDDYANEKLPGAARAVNEWCAKNRQKIAHFREEKSLAIINLL